MKQGIAPQAGKMNQIPYCDWLPRAGMMERYWPLGIARFVPATTFRQVQGGARKSSFAKYFPWQ